MIPVYNQIITRNDAKRVYKSILSGKVTHLGSEAIELEKWFKEYSGRKYAIACSNGTTALHLAFLASNIIKQKVIIPSCSFAATAFAATYCQNDIKFVDPDQNTFNMDLNIVEHILENEHIDAILAVHNYGNPIDMNKLLELKNKFKFKIIEDSCEAFTSEYDNIKIGAFGEVSVFSFYGNKVVTSGEGGMLLTDNDDIANKAILLRGQAQDHKKKFWHLDIGYNYRITNMQAALVNSQISRLDKTCKEIQRVYDCYKENLPKYLKMQESSILSKPCWWMISVISEISSFYNLASTKLFENNIESRPIFPPLPLMPPWINNHNINYPISIKLWQQGITLPSGPGLSNNQIIKICKILSSL